MKPKAMTQAERMEEAARTERRNAKSLNRWEEMEKKRAEEQRAKLEALKNRQLSGPVITWWSGPAKWIDGKLGLVGAKVLQEALHDPRPDPNLPGNAADGSPQHDQPGIQKEAERVVCDPQPARPDTHAFTPQTQDAQQLPSIRSTNLRQPDPLLEGTHHDPSSSVEAQSSSIHPTSPAICSFHSFATPSRAPEVLSRSRPPEPIRRPSSPALPSDPVVEYSGRNVVILQNITANEMRRPEIQHHVLIKKRNGKLPSERCFAFRFGRCLTERVHRAQPGALRHHGAGGEIPRSPDRPCVRQLVRVQRDPTAVGRRIPMEHLAWVLRWPDRQRRSRGSRPILENGLKLGGRRLRRRAWWVSRRRVGPGLACTWVEVEKAPFVGKGASRAIHPVGLIWTNALAFPHV